ncbi:MAG: PAS domain S-box protein, partial [Candidatus Eremiobacteraeota bacterium]|nr:PAS domain S-box protein [Candidatus Eremiobacteraeota bacterium]
MPKATYDATLLERLEPLLVHARTAIVGWDRELRISYWSQSATNLFGIDAREMLGKNVEESAFVHPADRPAVVERSLRLRGGHQRERVNINRNNRGDGRTIVCRWTRAAEQEDDRLSIISFVEDITREYAARDSILESEARFRALYADNPDPIFILDRDGFVTDVNDTARNDPEAGYAEAIGKHFYDLVPADQRAEHDAYFQRARSGLTQEYEITVADRTDTQRFLSIRTVPLFESGAFAGVYSIVHDDTLRRNEQEALAATERERYESVRRLRSLFEANPDGVIAVDRSGNITEANAASARIGGYAIDAIVGRNFEEFLTEEYLSTARRHFST